MDRTLYVGELTGQHLGKRVHIRSDASDGDGGPDWSVRGVLVKVSHRTGPVGDDITQQDPRVAIWLQIDPTEKPVKIIVGSKELVSVLMQ